MLAVEDDGPGIPAEHLEHVFERFYRVEGSLASGSGLGLAIARELAELMDGAVDARVPARPDGFSLELADGARHAARAASRRSRSRFHVKTTAARDRGYSETVGARAPVPSSPSLVVAPCSGGVAVLAARQRHRARLEGDDTTVFVPTAASAARDAARRRPPRRPLPGNSFDPAALYAQRAAGRRHDLRRLRRRQTADGESQGSGFVVSDDGDDPHERARDHDRGQGDTAPTRAPRGVYVEFRDGERVAGQDRRLGPLQRRRASLRVDPDDHALAPVPLGDSARVVVGEPVAAIGSPFGNQNSLAVGVVSATGRSIPSLTSEYRVADAIQIDAPINRGNSGGPLFDARGRVIGINAQIRVDSGTAEGVGFAIPINSARRSLRPARSRTGKVSYAYIGITTQDLTPGLARALRPRRRRAARSSPRCTDGTPAARRRHPRRRQTCELLNGLDVSARRRRHRRDRAVSPCGRPTTSSRIVTDRLLPGSGRSRSRVLRDGERARELPVRLAERPVAPRPEPEVV